jgi:hypothetical protein
MEIALRPALSLALTCLLGACGIEQNALMEPFHIPAPRSDSLYTPGEVTSGRLQYAGDGQPFAPVMTRRHPYPTQVQAIFAFERSRWTGAFQLADGAGISIRIFACRPGALNGTTLRAIAAREAVVVCVTDVIDEAGQVLSRMPLNFYYEGQAWRVHDPDPSYVPPRWSSRDPSPPRSAGWLGDRY